MLLPIEDVLMERDGLSREEAEEIVSDLSDRLLSLITDGEIGEAYYIMEEVGLEPDYLEELLP